MHKTHIHRFHPSIICPIEIFVYNVFGLSNLSIEISRNAAPNVQARGKFATHEARYLQVMASILFVAAECAEGTAG